MLNSANAFYVMAFPNLITYYYYFHNYYDQILSLKIDSYALTLSHQSKVMRIGKCYCC